MTRNIKNFLSSIFLICSITMVQNNAVIAKNFDDYVHIDDAKKIEFHTATEEMLIADYLKKQKQLKFDLELKDTSYLVDKVILIVGGSGTIGSELAQQLTNKMIKQVIIIDNHETGLYNIKRKLKKQYNIPDAQLACHLTDVRNKENMEAIFDRYQPNIIFHANHENTILNNISTKEFFDVNVVGTKNLLEVACDHTCTERFIFISSDKAGNPSTYYGRTKRINELLIKQFANKYPNIRFGSIRYCNILDAAGNFSIPTFKKQILNNEKIIIRKMIEGDLPIYYFIPIQSAAKLAIKTGSECVHGEIFKSDQDIVIPVQIDDLAKMIAQKYGVADIDRWFDENIIFVEGDAGEKKSESLSVGDPFTSTLVIKMQIDVNDEVILDEFIDLVFTLGGNLDTDGQMKNFLTQILDKKLFNLSGPIDVFKTNSLLLKYYLKIQRESNKKGIDEHLVNQIVDTFIITLPNDSIIAKEIFWKPSGIVFGCPFPNDLIEEISQLENEIIGSLHLNESEYWELPLQELHATISSYSRYSGVLIPRKELPKVFDIVSSYPPITLIFDGIVITSQGTILLKGFVKNNALFRLRNQLKNEIDGIIQKIVEIVHVKLGQIIKPIAVEEIEKINSEFYSYYIGEYTFDHITTCYGEQMELSN